MAEAEQERVGFIGLGIMGSRMAANLAHAGSDVTVWNRTRETAERWVAEHGGQVAATPAEVGAGSDVVITMVVDGAQVEAVLLGPDGVAAGAHEGLLCVDMSTIGPVAARETAARLSERGVAFADAPVTGSAPKAQDGTLTIMVGGEEADVTRALPLLEVMGELVVHVGGIGQGQTVKLVNNAIAIANCTVLAQALLAARRLDVDLDAALRVLGSGGAADSTMLGLKAAPMRAHDYTTLFKTEHMLKDVTLCLDATQRAGIPFPAAAEAREALIAAIGRGHGSDDFASIIEVYEDLADTRL